MRVLTVFSFILICWVSNRALKVRQDCLNSSWIAYTRIDGKRVENCRFQSRLSLNIFTSQLTIQDAEDLRSLERAEPAYDLFENLRPDLAINLNHSSPNAFQLVQGGLDLGSNWLKDPVQLRRALMMAILKEQPAYSQSSQFQLEVLSDFLILTLHGDENWEGDAGQSYSLAKDARFATAAANFIQYCRSPFRSLAHYSICEKSRDGDSDGDGQAWGFRALLSSALWRTYEKLGLSEKLVVLAKVRSGVKLPIMDLPRSANVENLVDWFALMFKEDAQALGMTQAQEGPLAVRRVLKELDVEAPTHWELTVDLTHTPAWREIVEQLKTRSQYRKQERALIFTPEGEVALPSGLSVDWTVADIQSQKHVMVACQWPQPEDALKIQARQMFVRQTCDKLKGAFWD